MNFICIRQEEQGMGDEKPITIHEFESKNVATALLHAVKNWPGGKVTIPVCEIQEPTDDPVLRYILRGL
jgi:hypothetical protein